MHHFTGFVALGDSFTEGLDDQRSDGTYRGWADLVAERLAAATPGFRYANLAIRGRMLDAVIDEQLPVALGTGADLVSFAAGANDAMRRRFDADRMAARLNEVAGAIVASGATLILFTTASDRARRLPAGRVLERRLVALNEIVRSIAATHRAIVVDHRGERSLADPRMWGLDRIHLSTLGHQLVAARVLAVLGRTADEAWTAPLPAAEPTRWLTARHADLEWARQHMVPWIRRRVTGRSSGDERSPKRPAFEPLF
jgi:lysophospholipase L1-like esterase